MNNRTCSGYPDEVKRFVEEHQLLKSGDKVLVALSGGADSVALLHILISLKEELGIEIYAAHFNHCIRGEEADRDERFSAVICEKYGVEFFRDKVNVPEIASRCGESVELCGRRLRYDYLRRVAEDQLGGAMIATAHHRDDNAETVLWNLTRGSGLAGLAGIPVQRDNIIRPLLCLSRVQIEDYCRENELFYVTDSTNLSDDYTRNKIRHQVMPTLRELNPSLDRGIERTAVIAREADEYLNKISIEELNKCKTEYGWSSEKLLKLEPIILKYAVKTVLENEDAPVDFCHIALIIETMRDGGAVNLGGGYTASCAQGVFRIIESNADADAACVPLTDYLKDHGTRVVVQNGQLYKAEDHQKINNLLLKHCIPYDIITCNTVFRTRRAGDTFTDARRDVTKTLKKLMNELKIPRELRDNVGVIAEGSTVLWIEDYGTSAQAQADLTCNCELFLLC